MAKSNVSIVKKSEDPESFAAHSASPGVSALAIFTAPTGFDESKLVRRNMPRMVKPGDVPIGAVVSGEIIAIVDSPVSTIKGKLLHLKHESGAEFVFPCTGVIRQALAPGRYDGKDEAENDKKLTQALEKEIGKNFYAKRQPDGTSTKFKKSMFVFDVFTTAK